MKLAVRAILQTLALIAAIAAMLFLPAGTLRFWQGWVFLAIVTAGTMLPLLYFLRRDPQLIARRMQNRERSSEHKKFRPLAIPLWIGSLLLPGFDLRVGWSAGLGAVPLWLTVFSQAVIVAGYVLLFEVMKTNTFAGSTIQVETGQGVISTGPYRVVRHPMYAALMLMLVFTSTALGTWVVLPLTLLMVPLLVNRLIHEERTLHRELAGYDEYCRRTRYRLIPGIY